MAVMMGNLYSALKQAGADEENAKKAAEEVAGFESRIFDLKTELKTEMAALKTEIAAIRGELAPLRWMVGFNLALAAAIAVRLFLPSQ